MYPIVCLHSSVLVHLSCFCVLVIVPIAAVIIGWRHLFKFWFPLDLHLGMGLFSVLRTSIMFSLVGVLMDIPTDSVGGFTLLHTLCRFYCSRVSHVAILINVRWYLIVHSTCLSLRTSDAEHCFMCFMAISMISLEKSAFILWLIFLLGCLFFWYWVVLLVCMYWREILYRYLCLQEVFLFVCFFLFFPILKVVFYWWFPLLCRYF